MKIVKNTTGSDILLNGTTIPPLSQYTIPVTEYTVWSVIPELPTLINSGDIVISNGEFDLPANVGIEHITTINGVISIHDNIELYPVLGEHAPEIFEVGPAAIGYKMEIGDVIYGNAKYDNISGDSVYFEIHCCIDNSVADRWISYTLDVITSTGDDSAVMSGSDYTGTFGPFEVPTTPYKIFKMFGQLPSSLFEDGKEYVFCGGKRIDATLNGKTNPVNDPIILRVCRIYFRRAG